MLERWIPPEQDMFDLTEKWRWSPRNGASAWHGRRSGASGPKVVLSVATPRSRQPAARHCAPRLKADAIEADVTERSEVAQRSRGHAAPRRLDILVNNAHHRAQPPHELSLTNGTTS